MRAPLLALLLVLAAISPSFAQPSDAERAEARQAFMRAEAAEQRKDWRTAITEYQRAYELAPHPDVLYNIGLDHERLEEYRDAATYYRRYLDDVPDAPDRARVERLIETLRARPGAVTVTSEPPGVELWVDGRAEGKTPLELRLSGKRVLELRSGAGIERRRITVEFGEPQAVKMELRPRTGTLVVVSNITGAEIRIDGEIVGTTPLTIPLVAGMHDVVVRSEGWSTYERSLAVPSEGTTQMTANLVRPEGYVAPPPPAPRWYVAASGGPDLVDSSIASYSLRAGYYLGRVDLSTGLGVLRDDALFLAEARYTWEGRRFRPYVRASAAWGADAAWLTGHVGYLVILNPKQRTQAALFLDLGFGKAYVGSYLDSSGQENGARAANVVPLLLGGQLSF